MSKQLSGREFVVAAGAGAILILILSGSLPGPEVSVSAAGQGAATSCRVEQAPMRDGVKLAT